MKIVAAEKDAAVGQRADIIKGFFTGGIVADTTGTTGITNIKNGYAAEVHIVIQNVGQIPAEKHSGRIPAEKTFER